MGWPFIFLKSAWFFCSTLLYNLKLLDILKAKVFIAHSCPTLCDPMDCSPPGSSGHGDSPGKNTGLGCHFLIQGIFPIQGSNLVFLHCRQILYRLSHQGSPLDILTFQKRKPSLGQARLHFLLSQTKQQVSDNMYLSCYPNFQNTMTANFLPHPKSCTDFSYDPS